MDDIFFTGDSPNSGDNKRRRARPSQDRFLDTDYSDENFNLNFKSKGNAQPFSQNSNQGGGFQVNIPESELDFFNEQPQNRTPKGRAVGRGNYPSTAQGTGMMNDDFGFAQQQVSGRVPVQHQNPQRRSDIPMPYDNQVNRNPRGHRVGSPRQQQNYSAQHNQQNDFFQGQPQKHSSKSSKKRSSKKPLVLGLLSIILILFVALGAFGLSAINSLDYDDTIVSNQYVNESELYSSSSVKNILFIGSDARGDVEGQRSDTMILFSIDTKNRQIKLTSFLRDSYVYIPSKGYKAKLNSAFSSGGPQLVMDTIEYNFGVKIDNYIMVDFVAFQQIIDLMGGVTIEGVTEKEAEYMNDVVKIPSVKEGTNKMNGFTALWYCRIRKLDSDFNRTQRQRKVIASVVNQAKKTNPFTLASMCKQVLPNISTDINKPELLSLAFGAVFSYLRYDIVQQQIPAEGTWSNERINGSAVISMNIDKNKEILINFLSTKYVEPVEEEE